MAVNKTFEDRRLEEIWKDSDRQRSRVQKEWGHIARIAQANHDSWDRQFMTTSVLALGFCFSFLNEFIPVRESTGTQLFILATLLFVATIVVIAINFNVAEKGMSASRILLRRNREVIDRIEYLRRLVTDCAREAILIEDAESERAKSIKEKKEKASADLEQVESDWLEESKDLNISSAHYAKRVMALNRLKTHAFISAIFLLTVFVVFNS